jgi:hypothetical protein
VLLGWIRLVRSIAPIAKFATFHSVPQQKCKNGQKRAGSAIDRSIKEPKSALYGTPALVEPAYNALFRRSNA